MNLLIKINDAIILLFQKESGGHMYKNSKILFLLMVVVIVGSILLTSCQPTATPAPTEPPKEPAVGTKEHPIKVLFVPSTDANVIVSGGKIMADALEKATGYKYEVSVPTSYAATIEEMCASPTDTIGFIPGLGYVLANQLCGVDAAFKAVRYGSSVYWAEIIVKRDSNFKTIKDLDGKKWGYGDVGSTSGYLVPLAMFKEAGINPGDKVATGGHPQSVKAVYNGEVDFATVFFTPASVPDGVEKWKEGADPDIPADLIKDCKVSEDKKKLTCGGYKVNDARANIREEAPDVIEKVKILAVSPAIPNDTMSFGPKFPKDVREKISSAMVEFAKTDDWKESIGKQDFYAWDGIAETKDAEFDFVRQMVAAAGITLESLGK
jgi:phosphonate transport system substrate-binding protein